MGKALVEGGKEMARGKDRRNDSAEGGKRGETWIMRKLQVGVEVQGQGLRMERMRADRGV